MLIRGRRKAGITMESNARTFSVKSDSWAKNVVFGNVTFVYPDNDDNKFLMSKADDSVIIDLQKPLRNLTQAEAEKLAAQKTWIVDATTAGHKIESPEEIRKKALQHAQAMTKEERAKYIKELQALNK